MIKNTLKNRKFAICLLLSALCICLALVLWTNAPVKATPPQPQTSGGVQVLVQVQNSNGQYIYSYTVINSGVQRVSAVRIGSENWTLQLVTPPHEWDFFNGLPASSVTSPAGWAATVITEQENRFLTLEWNTDDTSDTSGIQPGQTVGGFSVIVDAQDNSYQYTSFTADLGDGTMATGPLTQGGGEPTPTPTPIPTPTPTPPPCNPSPTLVQKCMNNGGDFNYETCRCE